MEIGLRSKGRLQLAPAPRRLLGPALCIALAMMAPNIARADTAAFDLAGPSLEIQVSHAGKTAPITTVPNLAVGDQLWVRADLATDQASAYLLVVAFLRGATNPPPKAWFYRLETWTPKGKAGLKVTVPEGAEQALIFLAPRTGGDFKTLVGAVRGRPGAFVRASQGLNQAYLDRSRLEAFLSAVRVTARKNPQQLGTISTLLARSLAVKLNAGCLQKAPEMQAACLSEGQDALVLDDGHNTSLTQTLTSGEPSDLIQQLGATPRAGGGYYSPYIGAVMDIVRVLDTLHTAQYQYIPALALARGDELSLMLNAAPSFHDPLSVLVTSLPAIESPEPPSLEPVNAKATYCAQAPDLVLPVEGAPLAFSTEYARNLALRLKTAEGEHLNLPVELDAARGGLVVDSAGLADVHFRDEIDASLHGDWGYTPFEGPRFHLQTVRPQHWTLSADDQAALIVGHDASVRLEASEASCTQAVTLLEPSGERRNLVWKRVGPDALAVTLPLKTAQPGPFALLVQQFGHTPPDALPLRAYVQAGQLDAFAFHAGDVAGVLSGVRLAEVAGLTLGGVLFTPGSLTTGEGRDALVLTTSDKSAAAGLKAGETAKAKVALKDGRSLDLKVTIGPPRPSAALINISAGPERVPPENAIALTNGHEIPAGSMLTFAIRAQTPAAFTENEKVEVAPANGLGDAVLTFKDGLVLQDAQVALARMDTSKAFTASTFGLLRFRLVDDGGPGDWRPLATLVRLPILKRLQCSAGPEPACQLTGRDLFLIDSVSIDPSFGHAVEVPEGFTAEVLQIPHPVAGRLYLKLRDDPSSISLATVPGGAEASNPPSKITQPAAPSPAGTVESLSQLGRSAPPEQRSP